MLQTVKCAAKCTVHVSACFFKSISCLHQSPVVSRGQTHQQQFHDKRFDLLSDLGGDIFAAPSNMNAGASSGFANFAHFNSHTSKEQTTYWFDLRTQSRKGLQDGIGRTSHCFVNQKEDFDLYSKWSGVCGVIILSWLELEQLSCGPFGMYRLKI